MNINKNISYNKNQSVLFKLLHAIYTG